MPNYLSTAQGEMGVKKEQLVRDFFYFAAAEIDKINGFFLQKMSEAEDEFEALSACFAEHASETHDDDACFDVSREARVWTGALALVSAGESAALNRAGAFRKSLELIRTYVTLNHLGFRKIFKKMDRRGGTLHQNQWMKERVRAQPFYASQRFARLMTRSDCLQALLEHPVDHTLLGTTFEDKETVSADFTCAVCMDALDKPVVLSCAHRFCESCVIQCHDMCLDDCPVCRSPEVVKVTIPVDDVLTAFMTTYISLPATPRHIALAQHHTSASHISMQLHTVP
jgi:hypothetical protein